MRHIHLIGIGGTGLSAIARLLLESGIVVSGSDRAASPSTQGLLEAGVDVRIGHQAENVVGADLVVRSSAIPDDNPEVIAARKAGIPVLKRSEFLGSIMEGKTCIAIAGTHGKTTTTSMLAWALTRMGQDPSFICGGVIENLGSNAHAGKGSAFVIEADEYDRMFLGLQPAIEVITNLEHDHPDCFPTPKDLYQAFTDFVHLLPAQGVLVSCVEDPGAERLFLAAKKEDQRVFACGIHQTTADGSTRMDAFTEKLTSQTGGGFTFDACIQERSVHVSLQVPGLHNVRNALAVLSVIHLLGLDLEAAANALGEFQGTRRRFEVRGEAGGIVVIDDYAHHPTEIRTTLAAARLRYPEHRLWAVWQPHTFSRTRLLFEDFTRSFDQADKVLVTDIYASREPAQDLSSAQIVTAMNHASVRYSGGLEETSRVLNSELQPGDVLMVLSAGDADQVSSCVLTHLKEIEND